VDVVLSSYDQSCNIDADCVTITSGNLCSGDCRCGGSTINKSGLATYESETSGLGASTCFCPAEGVPQCIGGTCTLCGPGSTDPSCGTTTSDGGVIYAESSTYEGGYYDGGSYDGGSYEASAADVTTGPKDSSTGICVDIVLSSYDQTCTTSADCIDITSGTLCPGSCDCGGSTINKDGQAKYNAATAGIKFGGCPCPAPLPPMCISGMCKL
jgi:hypothetical protein